MKTFKLHFHTLLFTIGITTSLLAQVNTIRIILPHKPGVITQHAAELLAKQLTDRCEAKIVVDTDAALHIKLLIEKMPDAESFSITDGGEKQIIITGSDERGLLYGIGKFLRSSRFDQGGFTPGSWRGVSAPEGKVRGMYFASHFGNFYEAAPIAEVQGYVNELALWGVNYLVVHFPQFQFNGFNDTAALHSLNRLKQIMRIAKVNGMKTGLIQVANGSFKSAPKELWNTPVPDQLGRRGHFGVNLNPANTKAHALLLQDWMQLLDQFNDAPLDAVVFWPYDEGGCGCKDCWPWGARGFPQLCREFSNIARERFPEMQVVVSTWVFDTPKAGEWDGLTRFLQKDKSWVNYIMADAHEDFPRFPLEKGVPGGLPLLNFPEISMWGQSPWGGYGANPLQGRLQRLWNQTDNKVSGGFPYSEGIYEDINKVICNQLYWARKRSTHDIVREYAAYEFSPAVAEDIVKAFDIFESNHDRDHIHSSAIEAFQLIQQAEQQLTPRVRQSWRWRIIYLRALIDKEMFVTKGKLEGAVLQQAFNELTSIYHAEHGHSMPIHPPVIQ